MRPLVVVVGVLIGCSSNSTEQAKKPAALPADDSSPASEPASPHSAGDYDACAGKSCGDSCTMCPPDDAECVETMEVKVCSASGECSGQAADCP